LGENWFEGNLSLLLSLVSKFENVGQHFLIFQELYDGNG
jgi:hypothetical protein